MQTFSTFEYYRDTYGGTLTESAYNKAAPDAYQEILNNTFGAAENAPESMGENLSRCECALVDAIDEFNDRPVGSGAVSSVNNDGFSVSYGSRMGDSGVTSEASVYLSICRRWLRHPVNLLHRGVKTRCGC